MLTPTEVTQRRKSRKYLQQKRIAMEEAVEKRVCEAVYKKIWRHKTTMDEVRDEKLRSKTAALTVVGIDLKDLGIDIADSSEETQKKINESLETARQCLAAMNDEKYPLGKLQHLTAAHKAIVDTLTNVFPSSSSADEILPTLIYTLITGPPEGINTISNFLFIQRFRTAAKIDGEAAYCLTNLEAAISFLENVDLSSLRADEAHTSAPSFASGSDLDDTAVAKPPSTAVAVAGSGSGSQGSARSSSRLSLPARSAQSPSRRLSDLFQPPAKVLGAANDAVRSTADQGLKNFTATLDNSFKFFLGRLNESQEKSPIAHAVVPKTLDEARLLVSPPVHADKDLDGDEALSVGDVLGAQPPPQSEQSEPATTTAATTTATPSSPSSLPPVPPRTSNAPSVEDRFIGLIGGRKPQQRVGVDIAEGMRPPRRVVSDNTTATTITGSSATTVSTSTSTSFFQSNSSTTNAFTSMKSFGNSLNPLSHIPDMIRGFGKNPEAEKEKEKKQEVEEEKKKKKQKQKRDQPPSPEPSSSPAPEPRKNLTDIKPPIRRFVELQDPSQLTLADIPELLEDYKRLALVVDELST
ncbi:hypothetical protein KEM56_001315 [Ascosphaera pollenicola]|nr:hypothetical protein KEM56_001315 [Ascosphaera pollenicola]